MKIIDLSEKNTVTNFNAVLSNVDGIILRIGYRGYGKSGKLVVDKKFEKYVTIVEKSCKPWGVYMIDQAISEQEGIGQAIFVDSVLKKHNLTNMRLGVWCDSETSNGGKGRGDLISRKSRTNNILAMLDKLKEFGYKNGIYASNSWLNDKLEYDRIKDRYIWNACYGSNNGKISVIPGRRKDLHQFTSRYIIEGVKNGVDMSILYNENFLADATKTNPTEPAKSVNPYDKPNEKIVLTRRKMLIQSREYVKWLQFNLVVKGFLPKTNDKGKSNIDGLYGIGTEKAVIAFQKANNVKADGIAGRVTFSLF